MTVGAARSGQCKGSLGNAGIKSVLKRMFNGVILSVCVSRKMVCDEYVTGGTGGCVIVRLSRPAPKSGTGNELYFVAHIWHMYHV